MSSSQTGQRPGTSLSEHVAREIQRDFPVSNKGRETVRRVAARGMKRFVFATAGGVKRVSIATGKRGLKSFKNLTSPRKKRGISLSDGINLAGKASISAPKIECRSNSVKEDLPPCHAFPFLTPATSIHDILNSYISLHPPQKRTLPPPPARAILLYQPTRIHTHSRPRSRSSRSSFDRPPSSSSYAPSFLRPSSRRSVRSRMTILSDVSSDVLGLTPIYEETGEMPSPLLRRPRIRVEDAEGGDEMRGRDPNSDRRSSRRSRKMRAANESGNVGSRHEQGEGEPRDYQPPASYSRYSTDSVFHDSAPSTDSSHLRRSQTAPHHLQLTNRYSNRVNLHLSTSSHRSSSVPGDPPAQYSQFSQDEHRDSRRGTQTIDPHYLQRAAARHRYTQSQTLTAEIDEVGSSTYLEVPRSTQSPNTSDASHVTGNTYHSGGRGDGSKRRRKGKPRLSIDTTVSQKTYRSSWGVQWHAPLLREENVPLPSLDFKSLDRHASI